MNDSIVKRSVVMGLIVALLGVSPLRADDAATISAGKKDGNGVLVHEVRSPYQAKATQIRVLLPDNTEKGKTYPVVYVLPVEAGTEHRYGNGLDEVRTHDLHNAHGAIFVAPTFAHLPWYADHPTRPELRQESDFVKVVVPFIDKTYPVKAQAESRLLLGFSKSGWGAWSLLLRHPKLFHKAAAWDAPLMLDKPGKYGSGDIFGTPENFERHRVSLLLENQAGTLGQGKRLILLGAGNFQAEHEQIHARMEQWKIPHEYRDGPRRKHDWHSGWVKDAVEILLDDWKSPRRPS